MNLEHSPSPWCNPHVDDDAFLGNITQSVLTLLQKIQLAFLFRIFEEVPTISSPTTWNIRGLTFVTRWSNTLPLETRSSGHNCHRKGKKGGRRTTVNKENKGTEAVRFGEARLNKEPNLND